MTEELPSSEIYRHLGEFITAHDGNNTVTSLLDALYARLEAAEARRLKEKESWIHLLKLTGEHVVEMNAAAGGPKLGMLEDVVALREERDRLSLHLSEINTEGLDAAKEIVAQRDLALARVEELEQALTKWKTAFAEQADVVVKENERLKNLPTLSKPSTPAEALLILAKWFAAYYAEDPEDWIAPDCIRLSSVAEEADKKLAAVRAIPHMAPDNSWAAGDSAEEAGWAYAIRYVRFVLGEPIQGCDNGMRPSPESEVK